MPSTENLDPSQISESAGGASRKEVDALKIIAVFMNHVDNHADNQKLICTDRKLRDDGYCEKPMAIISDVGAEFGSGLRHIRSPFFNALDLNAWQKRKMWKNSEGCEMHPFRMRLFSKGTFKPFTPSEEGRKFALELLNQMSDDQIRELFNGVSISELPFHSPEEKNVENWLKAFKQKRQELASRQCR